MGNPDTGDTTTPGRDHSTAGRVVSALTSHPLRTAVTVLFLLALGLISFDTAELHWPPTQLDLAQFLDQFWPQLFATTIGAGLGFYFALRADRHRATSEERKRKKEWATELDNLCQTLRGTIDDNGVVLQTLKSQLEDRQVSVGDRLDVVTWDVVGADVAHLIKAPGHRRLVAVYQQTVIQVSRLYDLYVSNQMGLLQSRGGPNDTRERLAADLIPLIARALKRGDELREILRNMEIAARKFQ